MTKLSQQPTVQTHVSRRAFLQCAALAAGASSAAVLTGGEAPVTADADPTPRAAKASSTPGAATSDAATSDTAKPKTTAPTWKYAICNETFGDWPPERIFQFAAECGYAGVEIAPFTIDPDVRKIPPTTRARLRDQAARAGIELVGLHWLLAKTRGFHLTSPDPAVRRQTAEYLRELGRFCHDMGGRVMVFGSPQQRNLLPGVSRQQATDYAVEVFRAIMPALADLDVILALEPLSHRTTTFMTTAAEAVAVAEQVDSPNCRLLLDCLAMSSETIAAADLIRTYHRHLVHFHANDRNGQGPGMGDLDFDAVFRALRDVGYRHYVSVEVFDTSPGGETIARRSIAHMRSVERRLTN